MLYTRTDDHTVVTLHEGQGWLALVLPVRSSGTVLRTTVWPDAGTATAYALTVALQAEESDQRKLGAAYGVDLTTRTEVTS